MPNTAKNCTNSSFNTPDNKIAIALSGGVDSAVSAHLLKEQGHSVIGLFMKNWEEDEGCSAAADYEDVLRICDTLQIDCYPLNFTKEYKERVFAEFIEGLRQGYTPNPDVLCNQHIKFDALFQKAQDLNIPILATGHHCQLDAQFRLCKGHDPNKDQSYFLSSVSQEVLRSVRFPIGHLSKSQVRTIAQEAGLCVHEKKDSTGICFIGKRNFAEFIKPYLGTAQGTFQTPEGKVLGHHEGAWFYTLGQRKGLGIGGPGDAWYVVAKDINTHTVIVAQGPDHPLLYTHHLQATNPFWISTPPSFPLRCQAKTRYRQPQQPCVVTQNADQTLLVEFDTQQRSVTQGQYVVFYQDELCLGNAMIQTSTPCALCSPNS